MALLPRRDASANAVRPSSTQRQTLLSATVPDASPPRPPRRGRGTPILAILTLAAIFALNAGTYFGLMRNDPTETFRFDTYFATQVGKQMTAESAAHPGITYLVPQATIDRDVFPFFARVIAGRGSLQTIRDRIRRHCPRGTRSCSRTANSTPHPTR